MDYRTPTIEGSAKTERQINRALRAYAVEADWILMSTCNYRCTYCFWDENDLGRKISPPAGIRQLASFFDNSELIWLLHLTGGEPFFYPEFVELCEALTQRHFISINTNADSAGVLQFAKLVDPARVDFINCGVHFAERNGRRRTDEFVRHVQALQDSGFQVLVTSVMYPDLFDSFPETWDWFKKNGIIVIPKALQGAHLGHDYPAGYSDSERRMFIEFSKRSESYYQEQLASRSEPPTIDPFSDRHLLLRGLPDNRGEFCDAGRSFVRIRENADIRRCGPEDTIGNIAEGWFDRRDAPSPCTEIECPYFCQKYVLSK